MDNPEKLATQSTQDEEKQNKTKTQYVLDTTMRKQIQILGLLAFLLTMTFKLFGFQIF